jgi:hypothetical protein
VFSLSPGKACTGKELFRFPIVFRGGSGNDLLQMNRKLVRVKTAMDKKAAEGIITER